MYCTSGLLAYPHRMGTLSDSVYPTAAYANPAGQGYMSFGTESSAFYTPLSGDTTDAWRSLSQTAAAAAGSSGWPYDSSMCGYSYGTSYGGLDVRRKNATRESTSTLKAWLYEHIKNPYPTKGEKIMLAIITKMTLTQVSTWFANARRRLKKENKMQWSPRNRTENDEDDKTSSDDDDDDGTAAGKDGGRSQKKTNAKDDDEDIVVDNAGSDELALAPNSDCSLAGEVQSPRGPCSAKYASGLSSSQDSLIHLNKADISHVGAGTRCPAVAQDFLSPCAAGGGFSSRGGISSRPNQSLYFTLHGKTSNMVGVSSSNPMFSRSPLSLGSLEEATEMKPRIWSLADVATSRPNHRHSSGHRTSGHLTTGGGNGTSGISCAGSLVQNFQPWENGSYCESTTHFNSASSYVTMTSYSRVHQQRDLAAPGVKIGAGAPTAGLNPKGVQRVPVSVSGQQQGGHYSCRMVNMMTPGGENLDAAGKVVTCGVRASADAGCPLVPDLTLNIGLNGTPYHHTQITSSAAPVDAAAGNTAFKPFPKRLGA